MKNFYVGTVDQQILYAGMNYHANKLNSHDQTAIMN